MSGHTPGPWIRYQKRNVVAIVVDDGTDREIIHWSGFDSSDFKQDGRSNARLIAAAPDLLKACKLAFKLPRPWIARAAGTGFISWDEWDAAMTTIEAAIQKAEGVK